MRLHARPLLWLLATVASSGACVDGAAPQSAPTTAAATVATVVATTDATVPLEPPVEASVAPVASPSSMEPPEGFPTEAFAEISEDPVIDEMAAEFQAILDDMAGGGGMAPR